MGKCTFHRGVKNCVPEQVIQEDQEELDKNEEEEEIEESN
ncbi:hypothetical protein CAEBREN_11748 [Caenorhabditis brenneri]|uniref:Uncharacterized protein n=1 Tax=Caenorhabditis brenneri TaxID=135651 RepID=G0P2M4_CAEBE|nr:hypothetical protein CAEBREN_11748 [Caenorhabditis brenneri]